MRTPDQTFPAWHFDDNASGSNVAGAFGAPSLSLAPMRNRAPPNLFPDFADFLPANRYGAGTAQLGSSALATDIRDNWRPSPHMLRGRQTSHGAAGYALDRGYNSALSTPATASFPPTPTMAYAHSGYAAAPWLKVGDLNTPPLSPSFHHATYGYLPTPPHSRTASLSRPVFGAKQRSTSCPAMPLHALTQPGSHLVPAYGLPPAHVDAAPRTPIPHLSQRDVAEIAALHGGRIPAASQVAPADTLKTRRPIMNTGNVGPMVVQEGDWICECGFVNWRRRRVCARCFPFANDVGDAIRDGAQKAALLAYAEPGGAPGPSRPHRYNSLPSTTPAMYIEDCNARAARPWAGTLQHAAPLASPTDHLADMGAGAARKKTQPIVIFPPLDF